jgi:hypothetical protein
LGKAKTGRPLSFRTQSFAATLFAELTGLSFKRATEIVEQNPDVVSGAMWQMCATAADSGVATNSHFKMWIWNVLRQHTKTF